MKDNDVLILSKQSLHHILTKGGQLKDKMKSFKCYVFQHNCAQFLESVTVYLSSSKFAISWCVPS